MFNCGKEDQEPRGCKLRSFRMEIGTYIYKYLQRFQSKPLGVQTYLGSDLFSRWSQTSMFGLRTWTQLYRVLEICQHESLHCCLVLLNIHSG